MAKDTNGILTVKKPHGIALKIPILSGNVSKRETIEVLTVSARTGILKPSLRKIPNHYIHSCVRHHGVNLYPDLMKNPMVINLELICNVLFFHHSVDECPDGYDQVNDNKKNEQVGVRIRFWNTFIECQPI